uniref:Ribose-phosphate pyrophosphokinase N-terminal domain-containing protein n=1 Tax=Periophthalmus magnuspinnatus TaxID=409849 RepID=A0A3B4AFS4_9GOBI
MNVPKTGYRVFSANSSAALRHVASSGPLQTVQINSKTRVDVKESVRGQTIFIIQTIPRDVNTAIMELLVMAYALKTSCCKMRKRGSIVSKLLASMLAKADSRLQKCNNCCKVTSSSQEVSNGNREHILK